MDINFCVSNLMPGVSYDKIAGYTTPTSKSGGLTAKKCLFTDFFWFSCLRCFIFTLKCNDCKKHLSLIYETTRTIDHVRRNTQTTD